MKKVTHISYSFDKGGAAKAASNIINCLAKKKFKIKKYSIVNLWKNDKIKFIKFLLANLFFRLIISKEKKHSFNYFNLNHSNFNIVSSDILHLHWIGNEFFSLNEILKNSDKIIWTIHDDWLRNLTQHIGTQKKQFNFLGNFFLKKISILKKEIYNKDITFIAPSKYIKKNLERVIKKKITIIQHPIDEKIFKFKKKKKNDLTFNFGGSNVFFDKNKGSDLIYNIVKNTKNKTNLKFKFIFFGSNNYKNIYQDDKNIELMNYIKPYKVANIFHKSSFSFVLSEIESFSLVAAESLMCGCPVICFDKNAVSELITHKKNGYILKDKNLEDFKNFIKWICKNPNHFNRKLIALDAKKKFSFKVISKKYANLYNAR